MGFFYAISFTDARGTTQGIACPSGRFKGCYNRAVDLKCFKSKELRDNWIASEKDAISLPVKYLRRYFRGYTLDEFNAEIENVKFECMTNISL